jgi:hypothetical protein
MVVKATVNNRFIGFSLSNGRRIAGRTPAHRYAAVYCKTGLALIGCTGRLLAKPSVDLNISICAFETVIGFFITIQRTPSLQGGVVSEPL